MTTTETLSVRQMISRIITESELSDPHAMVDEFVSSVPAGSEREVIRQLAREFFPMEATRLRGSTVRSLNGSKTGQVRDAWQSVLKMLEFDPLSGAWLRLEQATFEQLIGMADHRRGLAEANLNKAASYEALAKSLTRHDVKTVGELPIEDVEAAFS